MFDHAVDNIYLLPEDDHIWQRSGLGQTLWCPFLLSIGKQRVSEKKKYAW